MRTKFPFILLAVSALTYLVGQGIAQRPAAQRQAWEYKVIYQTASYKGGVLDAWDEWWEDGKKLPGPAVMSPKLAQLGAEGWELLSVTALSENNRTGHPGSAGDFGFGWGGATTANLWVLKRPK